MIKKVDVEQLLLGMFVTQLDRSWIETPFIIHKFQIKTLKQIDQLQRHCKYVYIDTEKGTDLHRETCPQSIIAPAPGITEPEKSSNQEEKDVPSPEVKEIRRSLEIHDQTKAVIGSILGDVRLGRTIETVKAKKAVESIIDTLMNDQNALLCLTQLKSRDEYTVYHSINVCILSLAFARRLGLQKDELGFLGLGALLHDVGKMKIPLEVLNKPGKLTDLEFEIMKSHVLLGKDLLENTPGFPAEALELVIQHHERHNGKGYPFGLIGNQISLLGGIVSIVDVYDAITTNRVYRGPMAPQEALKWIYQWSLTDFDPHLVERFIKTIGIYPVGSLVEINHADIGMVMSGNYENALQPNVLLLYNGQKQKYDPPLIVDLREIDPQRNKIRWSVSKVFGPIEKKELTGI